MHPDSATNYDLEYDCSGHAPFIQNYPIIPGPTQPNITTQPFHVVHFLYLVSKPILHVMKTYEPFAIYANLRTFWRWEYIEV